MTLLFLLLLTPLSLNGWDLHSVQKQNYSRVKRDPATSRVIRSAEKLYNEDTCAAELAPYPKIPLITVDPGVIYDLKSLNTFKTIGNSFLKMIKGRTLFETVSLAMKLSPISTVPKVLQLVEYQLKMAVLIVLGLLTATSILVTYVIFWSLKLTGNISEVECQTISDSEGPMRFVLTLLLCIFTIFVMFGCIIAWVANTHITNNVIEAGNHIGWTVNVTENFTRDIETQMDSLFIKQYKEEHLEILRTRLDEAVADAAGNVYLEVAQNVTDLYNRTLMLANSISDLQQPNLVAIRNLYSAHGEKLTKYTTEIKAAKKCATTISNWCDKGTSCTAALYIQPAWLTSVDPEHLYVDNVDIATTEAIRMSEQGDIAASGRAAYLHGKFFGNGSLEDPNLILYDDAVTYTGICYKTDLTTGVLLVDRDPPVIAPGADLTYKLQNNLKSSDQIEITSDKFHSSADRFSIIIQNSAANQHLKLVFVPNGEAGGPKVLVKQTYLSVETDRGTANYPTLIHGMAFTVTIKCTDTAFVVNINDEKTPLITVPYAGTLTLATAAQVILQGGLVGGEHSIFSGPLVVAPGVYKVTVNGILVTSISCTELEGCRIGDGNTATKLVGNQCCVDLQQHWEFQPGNETRPDSPANCGNGVKLDGDGNTVLGGAQEDYRGELKVSVKGTQCVPWGTVPKAGVNPPKNWDDWAALQGYKGLFNSDDPKDLQNMEFCRNPSPAVGVYGTATEADLRKRAWCWVSTTDWEYCAVPFCSSDTETAMKLAEQNGASAFFYPTCEHMEKAVFGADRPASKEFTYWKTTETARNEAYYNLDEAAAEMDSQFEVIQDRFRETNHIFHDIQVEILETISKGSEAGKFDQYRNVGTIAIVCLCMFSACLAVAGVCIGYCNVSNVPPHLRNTGCSLGGRLIKISSYWAAMMAIINLYIATLFFVPGSVFSLICEDYADKSLFKLFDDRVVVNYSVLGKAVLGNETYYNMTLNRLWLDCIDEKTLWVALALNENEDYDLPNFIQLNETLDIDATITSLLSKESLDFSLYPAYPTNLEQWLQYWNVSKAIDPEEIDWSAMLDSFGNDFLGQSKAKIDPTSATAVKINNRFFCDAFAPYGQQAVNSGDAEASACGTSFVRDLRAQCLKWILDYDEMQAAIRAINDHVAVMDEESKDFDEEFIKTLINKYSWTNIRLLSLDGDTSSHDIITQTLRDDWQPVLTNEVSCFSWQLNKTMQEDLTMCSPVSKIVNNTMDYFCDYMVTSMTLAWMSQGLLGFILALHMLVANSLSTYFLKMERRHPSDIPKQEMIEAFE